MMRYRYCYLAGVLFMASALLGHSGGQNPEQATTGLALRADAVEFAVPGYRAGRQGAPATGVRLHDVTFEGQSFPANRLRIQQLSEGVYELTGDADRVGNWRFELKDAADGYYGLGERFNELNHTHQVIRNMRALVLDYQNDKRAREAKDEYLFGPDLLAAPVIDENTSRAVYLPAGEWIDYWSGKHFTGSTVVIADAPLDVLPLYARAGAILPKIPDDVMTLVPPEESGNAAVKSLDDRRVYELWPTGSDFKSATITDFEGRTLSRTAHSLEINGHAARVTVRWRFDPATSVTLGDTPVELHTDAGGRYVEFNHTGRSMIHWK